MKIFKVLGKKGRITIPFEIRMKKGFRYNDIISFEDREDSIVIRKEKVCDGCRNQPICKPKDSVTLLEFLDSLSAEEQRAALVHLSVAWAEKQEVKDSEC